MVRRIGYGVLHSFTPDVKLHLPFPGLPPDREGMRENGRLIQSALSRIHVDRDVLVQEGDVLVERATGWGTHTGPLFEVPPTGKRVCWTEIHAYRMEGVQIAEVWSEADFLALLAQVSPESVNAANATAARDEERA